MKCALLKQNDVNRRDGAGEVVNLRNDGANESHGSKDTFARLHNDLESVKTPSIPKFINSPVLKCKESAGNAFRGSLEGLVEKDFEVILTIFLGTKFLRAPESVNGKFEKVHGFISGLALQQGQGNRTKRSRGVEPQIQSNSSCIT